MERQQKNETIARLRADIGRSQSVLFVDYTGLTVAEAENFRKQLRAAKIGYVVTKNTFLTKAVANTPYAPVAKVLKGTPTGVVFGFNDPIQAAKVTVDFAKECAHLKIKGGILENGALNADQAQALAKMPGRKEVLSMVAGQILAPGARLVAQLLGPGRKIAGVVAAVAEKQESKA